MILLINSCTLVDVTDITYVDNKVTTIVAINAGSYLTLTCRYGREVKGVNSYNVIATKVAKEIIKHLGKFKVSDLFIKGVVVRGKA